MDQTPPANRRSRNVPFYKAPENVLTSSQIIKDAKDSLQRPQLRPLSTRRPETPQENQRKLFGEQSVRDPTNRPPSAFSLGSRHFDSESRPVSGTRLTPLDVKSRVSDQEAIMSPKPPADPNRPVRRPSSRQRYTQQHSIDGNLSDSSYGMPRSKSGSLTDVSTVPTSPVGSKPSTPESQRRVRSGPKERTKQDKGSEEADTPPRSNSGKRRSLRGQSDSDRVENGISEVQRDGSAGKQRGSSGGKSGRREEASPSTKREDLGSAGRREEESPDEAHIYNTLIGPLVEEMTKHIVDKDPERLSALADKLYCALDEAGLLGKMCKRRSHILKTVFKLLDLESPKLLLKLARLILALRVSGNNLFNVCRLLFKVSREERNDVYFLEDNVLELLIETTRSTELLGSEALVYCVGSLKFLSSNHSVVKHLVKRHCYDALSKLLISINKQSEAGRPVDHHSDILVQLTATLRNLSEVGGSRSQMLALHLVEELCKVTDLYPDDADLMLNVARIFSKLSVHQDCCAVLASQPSHFRSFLQILHKYHRKEDLVVRVSYILGNLTSRFDESRQCLFDQPKALDILLHVFKYYCEQDHKVGGGECRSDSGDGKPASSKVEDVLIKIVRVIANLSINENIGPVLASSEHCVQLLIRILEQKDLHESEELVLNTMATINNLSYYNIKSSAITHNQIQLAQCLLKFLDHKHMEGLGEATRVFGNLSRERVVRDFLEDKKVDEFVVALLDSGDREVVFTAVGVLINLMADENRRSLLQKHDGISKLTDVLRDFGREDWNLATMVCQTLWNYSGRITSTNASFGETQGQDLIDVLDEFLDEETALDLDNIQPDVRHLNHGVWQNDFCHVASQLLQRLESHQSQFVPLDHPS